jgi:glutathione S-transferase
MLRVLGKATSINVRKVLWACTELDLSFEREDWGSGSRSTDDPAFLALNPNAMVPVLIDGDVVLWESNTICRYLAARERRTDLLPNTPAARAQVERWMDWQIAELNPAWRYAFMALVRRSPAHDDEAAIAASVAHWHRHMKVLDTQLAHTRAYVVGEAFTLADIVLGVSVHRWMQTPMQRPTLPAIAAYYQRLGARAGFRAHVDIGAP